MQWVLSSIVAEAPAAALLPCRAQRCLVLNLLLLLPPLLPLLLQLLVVLSLEDGNAVCGAVVAKLHCGWPATSQMTEDDCRFY